MLMRVLLLAKLHPTQGVEVFGASRQDLLDMAKENGLHELSAADIEELGPATKTHAGRDATREMDQRLARQRAARKVRNDAAWKSTRRRASASRATSTPRPPLNFVLACHFGHTRHHITLRPMRSLGALNCALNKCQSSYHYQW